MRKGVVPVYHKKVLVEKMRHHACWMAESRRYLRHAYESLPADVVLFPYQVDLLVELGVLTRGEAAERKR